MATSNVTTSNISNILIQKMGKQLGDRQSHEIISIGTIEVCNYYYYYYYYYYCLELIGSVNQKATGFNQTQACIIGSPCIVLQQFNEINDIVSDLGIVLMLAVD